jgi:beta-lysine N6-acetyltransferase
MNDRLETIDGALVQHGPNSDRIYLMKLGEAAIDRLAPQLEALAEAQGYGKIIAKVPLDAAAWLASNGFVEEARIPEYDRRERDIVLMSCFRDSRRAHSSRSVGIAAILQRCPRDDRERRLPTGYAMRTARPEDAPAMAALYREVFPSYPFPIHDPAYLVETMASHVRYFLVETDHRLVAQASGEIDAAAAAAEMTDFATHVSQRGKGLASRLLRTMERSLAGEGILTAYTMARAVSEGMNRTFSRSGYQFGGTLVNNTQISGRIESMNVWHKALSTRR